jgi:hypothetical protein
MSIADNDALYDRINSTWPANKSKEGTEFRKYVATIVARNCSRGNLTHSAADNAVSHLMDKEDAFKDLVDGAWKDKEFEALGESRNFPFSSLSRLKFLLTT